MNKIYVLDTNVLLADPLAIYSFGDNDIVIPSVVIEELDTKKKQMDEVGRNARYVSRELDKLREKGKLHIGVRLDNGGFLKVVASQVEDRLYEAFLTDSNDNAIISVAHKIKNETDLNTKVVIVSRDTNVRIKADVMGVEAEDYEHDKVITSDDEKYKGYIEIDDLELINKFYENKKRLKVDLDLYENQYVILKNGQSSAIARYNDGELTALFNYKDEQIWGVSARNVQQKFALDLLLDRNIPLITLVGKAGTGKTLLTLAAALLQTMDEHIYKKMLVTRPIVPLGKDIGYLPGEKEEKLAPWMQPFYDNLEFLFNCKKDGELNKILDGMQGQLQVDALTYIRGRSIPEQFIIVDEAQNMTQHEVKTMLTRVGEGSKIVLMGDPQQIDNPYLDEYSNGLTYVIEKMKHLKETGHVTLHKGERSTLAQLCADML